MELYMDTEKVLPKNTQPLILLACLLYPLWKPFHI